MTDSVADSLWLVQRGIPLVSSKPSLRVWEFVRHLGGVNYTLRGPPQLMMRAFEW